ncbi:MAG: bifunctional ADP-dependent NAD(P)H-hydrate dehydratase/NAD(P)H-hydrate epimerase [Sandaracinus sp.]|nr:bifunctional ADP-dependent NAD(P)H-hydrate dehydratase/NAD(P)H-hydrate epimerase [Sandaracinus sp.]
MPLLGKEAVRALDTASIARGVPGIVLMENAGRGATEAILARFGDHLQRPLIVGGGGQNGGDAWVIARHLLVHGIRPRALVISRDPSRIGGDASPNLHALRSLVAEVEGASVEDVAPEAIGSIRLDGSLVIDGLFGTGLDRPIEGAYAEVVRRLDAAPAPLVALDLPSGIDADTGQVLGVAPHAALTVTFGAQKRGLHQYPGVAHAGEVVLAPIGAPAPSASPVMLVEDSDVAAAVSVRPGDAHKGTAGHVVVVAGSPGTTGAALLAGLGAMRGGAGLVTLATRADQAGMDQRVVELMTAAVGDVDDALRIIAAKADTVVVGPGLGTDDEGMELARGVALEAGAPAVLDADALTAFAGDLEALRKAPAPRVLTPHPGEAARLLGVETAEVQADRYGAAAAIARASGQVVALKGARTVISDGERARVSPAGTPALGVGGTGDVLAGITGAMLGEGRTAFDAAWIAVHLHGRAGERAAVTDRGLFAREVADAVPHVLAALR